MSIVNHVVVRITWSGIENGVNKKKRRKIAQGGNDYEIWKSHRVRWSSFEECQIISRNEDAGTLFYDAPINTFYFDSVEISGIRRLIVDERRQVSKNTRSSLTRSSFRAPFSQVRVNNYRNHSFDSTSSPTLTKREREREISRNPEIRAVNPNKFGILGSLRLVFLLVRRDDDRSVFSSPLPSVLGDASCVIVDTRISQK